MSGNVSSSAVQDRRSARFREQAAGRVRADADQTGQVPLRPGHITTL